MHCPAIPSILDTNRFRFVHGGTNRGRIFALRHILTKWNFFADDTHPGAALVVIVGWAVWKAVMQKLASEFLRDPAHIRISVRKNTMNYGRLGCVP
jgi:hypothetical protein